MVQEAKNRDDQSELTPEVIRRIRERLGLTQAEAGELLGGGPRAFTKYESGAIKPAAAVANLLRLLDAEPSALSTLTGRKPNPIDSDGAGPLEVTGRHIEVLSDRKFVMLLRRLLVAEAQSNGLPLGGIHVASNITEPDGGEDARIEWSGEPEKTAYLPGRLCQFQLKATKISASRAAADVLASDRTVKPMVKSVLEAGGFYLMLCNRPCSETRIKAIEKSIREALAGSGLKVKAEQVRFRDADQIAQWVNTHVPVAVWLLEQTEPGRARPFRSWMHWAGRYEHESSPWVPDGRLTAFREKLLELVSRPRGVARVIGLSGVGKSRLVLEALGPSDGDEAAALNLHDIVLYAVESEVGATDLKSAVQDLADSAVRAIVVIDRCPAASHQDLAAIVKRLGSRLSLITIDHDTSYGDSLPEGVLEVKQADESVIVGIIQRIAPNLLEDDRRKLIQFARGFPQMANLLGESWIKHASIARATDQELFDRILLGRKPSDPQLLKDAGMLLGAFGLLGWHSLADIETVAPFSIGRSAEELDRAFSELEARGVVQKHGRLISLQPKPLAMELAARQWHNWKPDRWDELIAGSLPKRLRVNAARQLSLLDDRPVATKVVQHVCRYNGPLSSFDAFLHEGTTEVLNHLAQIDPQSVGDLIDHVLTRVPPERLQSLSQDSCRELVWALERVAFASPTFEQGAHLLLKLATAGDEAWGRGAADRFKSLFPVVGGNTEADGDARLRLLESLVHERDPREMPVVVDALLEAVNTHSRVRMIGPELRGSLPARQPWYPATWKNLWDYIKACLKLLERIASQPDDLGSRAKTGIGRQFSSLVSAGLLEDVERLVLSISDIHSEWTEALVSLGDVLQYDSDRLDPTKTSRVRKLIDKLQPKALANRVRFLITEMPWDYPIDEKLDHEERRKRQLQAVKDLARDILKEPQQLLQCLPELNVGSQRMAYEFGQEIAQLSENPLQLEAAIRSAFTEASQERRNPAFLVGYYTGLSRQHAKVVEAFKNDAVQSPEFGPVLPLLCASVGITEADVRLVCEGLRTGRIPPSSLIDWSLGAVMKDIPAAVLAPLFDMLLERDEEAYVVALDLVGMYVFGQQARLEELRPQIKLIAANVRLAPRRHPGHQHDYLFREIVGWLLSKGWEDPEARAVAQTLAKYVAEQPNGTGVELIKPLLPEILSNFYAVAWPVLGDAIVSDKAKAWLLEHVLGDNFSFEREKRPPVLKVPEEVLFSWCHRYPDTAPAFLAAVVPFLTNLREDSPERTLHPIAKRLLDEFGAREDVLNRFTANLKTFGWSGSLTTYYGLFEPTLKALETHSIRSVRRWARRMLTNFQREIEAVKIEEEERDANWRI